MNCVANRMPCNCCPGHTEYLKPPVRVICSIHTAYTVSTSLGLDGTKVK